MFFPLIAGFIFGAALLWLIPWMRNKGIKTTWYDWVIGVTGILLLLFTIQNIQGSIVEFQPGVGYMFLLVTGLPALILLIVAWQLIARRERATG